MDMSGEYRIPAPRAVVWAGLNDPEILKQSIPGCDELNKVSDTELTAKVTAKVGPVRATFSGKVTLSNIQPPAGYTITGEGQGGAAGFAKGGADVELVEDGDGTILKYAAKSTVGGKLAQIGSRLIDSTAKKMANDFFERFAAAVVARQDAATAAPSLATDDTVSPAPAAVEDPAPAPDAAPAGVPAAATAPVADKKGVNPLIWVAVVVGAVAVLLLIFT